MDQKSVILSEDFMKALSRPIKVGVVLRWHKMGPYLYIYI